MVTLATLLLSWDGVKNPPLTGGCKNTAKASSSRAISGGPALGTAVLLQPVQKHEDQPVGGEQPLVGVVEAAPLGPAEGSGKERGAREVWDGTSTANPLHDLNMWLGVPIAPEIWHSLVLCLGGA